MAGVEVRKTVIDPKFGIGCGRLGEEWVRKMEPFVVVVRSMIRIRVVANKIVIAVCLLMLPVVVGVPMVVITGLVVFVRPILRL